MDQIVLNKFVSTVKRHTHKQIKQNKEQKQDPKKPLRLDKFLNAFIGTLFAKFRRRCPRRPLLKI